MNRNPEHPKRILVSASGSGGHLMPARYAIQEFLRRGAEVAFLGTGRPLESELLGDLGIPLHQIPLEGLQNTGLSGKVQFLKGFFPNLSRVRHVFREFRPTAVVGFGGYATFFPVLWARMAGIPSLIHEAEVKPGSANRALSYFATVISCAFEETRFPGPGRRIHTGHPVRPELKKLLGQSRSVSSPQHLLILGGSQGAKAIDEACSALAPLFRRLGLQVWHQCRPEMKETLEARYQEFEVPHTVMPFIHELDKAFEWAHFVLSRAGAGAVMEIGFVNCPAIFVPFPFAQGGHQRINAEILEKQGKALIVDEGDGFQERLAVAIERFVEPEFFNRIRVRAARARPTDAVETIVSTVFDLSEGKKPKPQAIAASRS